MAGRFSIEAIFKGTDRFSPMLGAIRASTGRFASGMGTAVREVDRGFDRLVGSFKAIGFAAVGMGAVIGGAGVLGIESLARASFATEDALAKLGTAITPATGTIESALGEAKKAAIDWSKSHIQSAEAFTQANYRMASAGLDSVRALAGTKAALTLATATFGDATTAGNLLAGLYNNMGDKSRGAGVEFGRLADRVAKAQQMFQLAGLGQLNEGLTYGAPAAKILGMNVEQLVTVIGALNTANLQGGHAGRAFAATARQMISASRELGFGLKKDADGGVDFVGTLGNIEKKFGSFAKMTDDQKLAFQKAFGEEGIRTVALLVGKVGELSASLDKVTTSTGAATDAQKRVEGTHTSQLQIFANRVDAVKESLADGLFPVLDQFSPRVFGAIDSLGAWANANKELIRTDVEGFLGRAIPLVRDFGRGFARGFGDSIGPLRTVTGWVVKLADAVPGLSSAATAGERFGRTAGALLTVAVGVKGISSAMGLLDTAMAANPWTLALGGLIAIGTAAYVYKDDIAEFARKHEVLVGIVGGGAVIFLGFATAERAVAAATWVMNAARVALAGVTWGVAAAETFFIGEVTAGAVATDGAAASFVAADLALGPLLLGLGALAVAIGAVVYEWHELEKATGGHILAGVEGMFTGKGFFGGVDEAMNEDARRKFAAEHGGANKTALGGASGGAGDEEQGRFSLASLFAPGGALAAPQLNAALHPADAPGGPPPQLSAAGASGVDPADLRELIAVLKRREAEKLEIDVKAADGTKVDVKQPNAGSKRPISVRNSGGLAR